MRKCTYIAAAVMTLISSQAFAWGAVSGVGTCRSKLVTIKAATNMSQADGFSFTGLKMEVDSARVKGEVAAHSTNKKLAQGSYLYPNLFTIVTTGDESVESIKVVMSKILSDINHDDKAEIHIYRKGKAVEKQKALCHFEIDDEAAQKIVKASEEKEENADDGIDHNDGIIENTNCTDIEVVFKPLDEDKRRYLLLVSAFSKKGEDMVGGKRTDRLVSGANGFDVVTLSGREFDLKTCNFLP